MTEQDGTVIDILQNLEQQNLRIQHEQKLATSTLDKRALSIAITHLETAQLWLILALTNWHEPCI